MRNEKSAVRIVMLAFLAGLLVLSAGAEQVCINFDEWLPPLQALEGGHTVPVYHYADEGVLISAGRVLDEFGNPVPLAELEPGIAVNSIYFPEAMSQPNFFCGTVEQGLGDAGYRIDFVDPVTHELLGMTGAVEVAMVGVGTRYHYIRFFDVAGNEILSGITVQIIHWNQTPYSPATAITIYDGRTAPPTEYPVYYDPWYVNRNTVGSPVTSYRTPPVIVRNYEPNEGTLRMPLMEAWLYPLVYSVYGDGVFDIDYLIISRDSDATAPIGSIVFEQRCAPNYGGDGLDNICFERRKPPGEHRTQTQGGWGAPPHGANPGAILAANFADVFPDGLLVGSPDCHYILLTSAEAVEAFLPVGGTPQPLQDSFLNPLAAEVKRKGGVFACQVTAANISLAFSDYTAGGGTLETFGTPEFGADLSEVLLAEIGIELEPDHPLFSHTVGDAIALANLVLGCGEGELPAGLKVSQLNDIITQINEAFVDGEQP